MSISRLTCWALACALTARALADEAAPPTVAPLVAQEPKAADAGQAPPPAAPTTEPLSQPASVGASEPEALPPAVPNELTIEGLIQLALGSNPAIAQSAARVEALRGRWVQVGLPPNPAVGFLSTETGNNAKGGQNGGYGAQEFVTAGKLGLNRAVVAQEIERAQQQLAALQLRTTTDVRRAAYATLVAQRRLNLAEQLRELSSQAVQASRELQKAQEIPLAGLLQSEVEQQNAAIVSLTARNDYNASWRRLTAVTGVDLPQQPIAGDVTKLPDILDWDEQLLRVVTTSPEVGAADADVMRAQAALRRATVEPYPNVTVQLSAQYDESSNYTIGGAQIGLPLPLWNRNQGGVRQAQAEVAEARRNANRVQLDLKQRLADAFQRYTTARAQAETYSTSILPRAQQTFELVQRGYRLGELGYLDLLNAQRTYSQTNLAYLDALNNLWASYTEIDGLLLSDSLSSTSQ